MPVHQVKRVWFDDIDLDQLIPNQVRAAFLLKLPFRLRVSSLARFSLSLSTPYEVCCRNKFLIPTGTDPLDVFKALGRDHENLWTDALVLVRNPSVDSQAIEYLRTQGTSGDTNVLSGSMFDAMTALNQLIIGYSTVTQEMYGGNPLSLLTQFAFIAGLKWFFVIACREDYSFSDEDIGWMFDPPATQRIVSYPELYGSLDDLPTEKLNGIESCVDKQQKYIFYELAFRAKSHMVSGDFIAALLMAVAAMESIHAVYVRHVLSQRVKSNEGSFSQLIERFLREQGLHTLTQLTPFLLMNEEDRPDKDSIMAATKAIQIRNDIMHSLTTQSGKYKLRNHTPRAISEAYAGALKVYSSYLEAIEKTKASASSG